MNESIENLVEAAESVISYGTDPDDVPEDHRTVYGRMMKKLKDAAKVARDQFLTGKDER